MQARIRRANAGRANMRPITATRLGGMERKAARMRRIRKSRMTKFTDLKLDPKVLQAIAEAGYENPTPI